jgi:hypothetical protein
MTPGGQEWNKLPRLCKTMLGGPISSLAVEKNWAAVLLLTPSPLGLVGNSLKRAHSEVP